MRNALPKHPALWRGNQLARVRAGVSTGHSALDAELPGNGWPLAALTEILPQTSGIGEVRLLAPALARLSSQGKWIFCVAPPVLPYAPTLQAWGIELARLAIVRTRNAQETLWATEQILKSSICGAVMTWIQPHEECKITYKALQRLQHAAETQAALGTIFRNPNAASVLNNPTALPLRLSLESAQDGRTVIRILKRRGPILETPLWLDSFPSAGYGGGRTFPSPDIHAVASPLFSSSSIRMPAVVA